MAEQGSATTWTRLEPQTRSQDLREGAAAQVADAAWLLARQWHFGEFHASDGGSPASARLRLATGVLSGYRAHGTDGDHWSPYAQRELPLEVLVEREPPALDLGLRADGGRRFLRLLDRAGAGIYRAVFTAAYPLPGAPAEAPLDPAGAALLAVLAGRVPDGAALATALGALGASPPALPPDPPIAPADRPKVLAAATAWLAWWQDLAEAQPDAGEAWDPTRMEHAFALGARLGAAGSETTLVAAEYPGGSLDWYDLEVATDGTTVPSQVAGSDLVRTVLPTAVRYPGMPASRFWEFEDGRVYLGGIEAGAADLGRMLLSEFAILYSDDWFVVPVELDVGTIARVGSLVVTDTFGVRSLVGPAAHDDWDMFRLAAAGGDAALFVLAPAIADAHEGPPLEELLLLRDENANVVWGVERLVESAAGGAFDRHEQYLAALRDAAARPPSPPLWPPDPTGDLAYVLRAGAPPEHWLALLPEDDPSGLRLALRALPRPGTGTPIEPLGRLLGATDRLADEEVPRDGIRVVRRWRLTRGADGRTHLWRGRRKLTGRGEASSGFRHDVVGRADAGAFEDAAPSIDGVAQAGRPLRALTRGSSRTPPLELAFQWRRCDAAGEACEPIAGARAAAYTPVAADVGATLRVTVTATGAGGTLSATSPATAAVAPPLAPPVATAPPAVSGQARVGAALTAASGSWSGTPPLDLAYQWRRCDATGARATDIAGATATTYTPVALDQGSTLRVAERASNELGSATAVSEPSAVVGPPPAAPQAQFAPTIFGAPSLGRELTSTPGIWAGEPPMALTQHWQRSDAAGTTFAPIAGATAATYVVVAADIGRRLRTVVTARNAVGSLASESAPTADVPPAPVAPVNAVAPSIAGIAAAGQWLTVSPGEWTGTSPRFAYQWLRCDAQGRSCRPIDGALGGAFRTTAADAGATLCAEVHASNDAGSAIARSAVTAAIAAPPSLQAPPAITGTPEPGAELTASPGTWSGSGPLLYAYRWTRCDARGAACSDIAGATDATYVVGPVDVGSSIRVVVTVVNAAGQASATSANTAAVAQPSPPANVAAPSIAGSPLVGETLTAQRGAWSGSPATGWAYRWRRCDATGGACADIPGATAATYVPAGEDAGCAIRVVVSAINAVGSASEVSSPTAAVQSRSEPPSNKEPPTISGVAQVGEILRADPGLWSPDPKELAYTWLRCDADGKACAEIRDATSQAYVPRASDELLSAGGEGGGDVGSTLRVAVTAVNDGGAVTARSEPTAVVKAAEDPPKDEPPPTK